MRNASPTLGDMSPKENHTPNEINESEGQPT